VFAINNNLQGFFVEITTSAYNQMVDGAAAKAAPTPEGKTTITPEIADLKPIQL
jgi:hypothetical protein